MKWRDIGHCGKDHEANVDINEAKREVQIPIWEFNHPKMENQKHCSHNNHSIDQVISH